MFLFVTDYRTHHVPFRLIGFPIIRISSSEWLALGKPLALIDIFTCSNLGINLVDKLNPELRARVLFVSPCCFYNQTFCYENPIMKLIPCPLHARVSLFKLFGCDGGATGIPRLNLDSFKESVVTRGMISDDNVNSMSRPIYTSNSDEKVRVLAEGRAGLYSRLKSGLRIPIGAGAFLESCIFGTQNNVQWVVHGYDQPVNRELARSLSPREVRTSAVFRKRELIRLGTMYNNNRLVSDVLRFFKNNMENLSW